MKRSFVMYDDQWEVFRSMDDENAGKLIKSIFEYANTGEPPKLDGLMNAVFSAFKSTLDRDSEKYAKTVERNQLNGQKGGRPKSKENPVGSSGLPVEPIKSHSGSGSGIDSGSEKLTSVADAPALESETKPTSPKPSPSQSKKNVVFRAPTKDEVAKWAGEWALKKERNAVAVAKVAEEARTYYERLDWTNRNGKAVKVWKTTIAGNWLTDEKIVKAQSGSQYTPTAPTMTDAQRKAQGLNIF